MDNISEMINNSLKELKELVDVDIIVGKPIYYDNTLVLPISKIKCSYLSGGFNEIKNTNTGVIGTNVSIIPIAFLVKEKDHFKVLNVEGDSSIYYIEELIFDTIKQVLSFFKKGNKE